MRMGDKKEDARIPEHDPFTHAQRNRFIRILQVVLFLDLIGVALVLPIMYDYAKNLGADPKMFGWIGTIYSVCQLIGSPCMAWVMNTFGRKEALLVNFVGAAASYLGAAFAPSFWFLCMMRIPVGLTKKSMTIAAAYAAQLTEPGRRSVALGEMRTVVSLAFVVGPAVGGYLSKYDLKLPAVVSVCIYLLDFLIVLLCLPHVSHEPVPKPESEQKKPKPVAIWKKLWNPKSVGEGHLLLFLVLSSICLEICERLNRAALPVVLRENLQLGTEKTGYMWSVNAALTAFAGGIGIRLLTHRFGDHKVTRAGATTAVFALVVLSTTTSFWPFAFAYSTYLVSALVSETCLTTILTHEVPQEQVGSILSAMESTNSVIGVVAPLAAGYLSSWSSVATSLVAACFCLIARVLMRRLPHYHAHKE